MFRWCQRLFRRPAPPHPLAVAARAPDPEVRRGAAEQLGGVPEAWAEEELFRLLTDPHAPVRDAARDALRGRGPAAVPALVRGLSHPRTEVGVTAAELLGELPSPEAVRPLLVALVYAERPVQRAAGRALGRCGALAVPVLRAALDEPQPWVRGQIAAALAEAEAVGRQSQQAEPGAAPGHGGG